MANIEEQDALLREILQQHQRHPHPNLSGGRLRLHVAIHAVVETQLRESDPPETAATFARLCAAGLDKHEAQHAIGTVVADEMAAIVGQQQTFDGERYVSALRALTAAGYRSMFADQPPATTREPRGKG